MKLAQFWSAYAKAPADTEQKIQCKLCNHYCLISEGKVGVCAVRKNIKGKLYSLVYGKVIVENGKLVGSADDGRWVKRRVANEMLARAAV